MNNTVLVEKKLRQRLKLACVILCVFCLCFIAVLVSVVMIDKLNLNGQTNEVTGVLKEVYVKSSNTITLDEDKDLNVVWYDVADVDLNNYIGKSITVIVTSRTFAGANPWALGLVVDGETVVDYQTTLDSQRASNAEMTTVIIAVTVVLCVATCGVFIWRFNVQPLVERELYKEFGEFLSQRQPPCKQRKILIVYISVYFVLLLALLITSIAIDPEAETISELAPAAKAVLWTLLGVGIAGIAGLFVVKEWVTRKEIDFYADKLPFDFSDISHAPLRKKVKEDLQQEILKERNEHPYTFADGGNGYDVTFGEKGVFLTVPFDETELPNTPIAMPDVNDIFDEVKPTEKDENATLENVPASAKNKQFFTYEQLNLEAVAHYRKSNRPMMIIVKSRLTRNDDFPEEFVNDIHIAFDLNLANTLKLFNVEVENLEYLLQNKKRLMLENCLTFSKNKQKASK